MNSFLPWLAELRRLFHTADQVSGAPAVWTITEPAAQDTGDGLPGAAGPGDPVPAGQAGLLAPRDDA